MHDALRAKLEESAKAGSRSLHAEVVARLEASFKSQAESEEEINKRALISSDSAVHAIAEKVSERINSPNIPIDQKWLERYLEIIEKSYAVRQREWWEKKYLATIQKICRHR